MLPKEHGSSQRDRGDGRAAKTQAADAHGYPAAPPLNGGELWKPLDDGRR
jgi:hypothetical protein